VVERRREASATAVVFRRDEVGKEEVEEVEEVEPTATDLPLRPVHVQLVSIDAKAKCDGGREVELRYLN